MVMKGKSGPILSPEEIKKQKEACWFCQLAKFSNHHIFPITITNDQDDATLPRGFQFIENSILCEGVEAADEDFRTGCDCGNDKSCERMVCSCLQDMNIQTENPKAKVYAYLSRGPNKGCLRDAVLDSRDPIYECHEKCKCSSECNNRVVGRGRQVPLEIFRTKGGKRGWGMSQGFYNSFGITTPLTF
jgi:[histone H3]-lysine9 N-trimethyltransferase SUV39H